MTLLVDRTANRDGGETALVVPRTYLNALVVGSQNIKEETGVLLEMLSATSAIGEDIFKAGVSLKLWQLPQKS